MSDRSIPDDGEPSIELFNRELAALEAEGKGTWFTAPWLFAESVASLHCFLVLILKSRIPGVICTPENSTWVNNPSHSLGIVWFEATLLNPKPWNTTTPSLPKRWRLSKAAATEPTVCSFLSYARITMFTFRAELASSIHEIEIEKDKIQSDPAKLSVLFKEMIQMCLWYVPCQAGAPDIQQTLSQG